MIEMGNGAILKDIMPKFFRKEYSEFEEFFV